ncbi:MAG: asparagine synthase-related protein, partial [Sphingomonadales bacterium]
LRSWAIEPLLSMLPGGDSASLVGRARRHIDHYKTPMPKRIYAYETGANTPVEEMFEPDVTTQFDPEYFDKLALEAYSRPESGAMLQRMMHLDLQVTLADGDLRKVRRMCLAAGVQVRFPLLDDEVVAFSARVPPDVMIQDGRLRSFFKNAMRGFLPDEIIAKPKHGFGLPFQQWLKTDSRLKELVEDSLSAFAKRNYVRPQFLDRVRTSHRNAKVTGLDGLAYDIMVLELWLQEHAIGAKSASHGTNRPISAAVGGIS